MTRRRSISTYTYTACLLTAALSLTACSATGSTASSAAPATAPASSTSPSPSLSPSTTATSGSTTTAAGMCSTIDQAAAESILGFTTKPGLSSSAGAGTAGMQKLDGCAYINETSGSLGYTVAKVSPQIGQGMIGAIKARMAGAGGAVTMFDAGLPSSVSFTQHLPHGVDSQITVLAGDRLISVASTRKDSNIAKAQAAAKEAAQRLVASG